MLSEDRIGNAAIIVQTPIPKNLRPELRKINSVKDIDSLSPENTIFPTCATAEACIRIIYPRINHNSKIAVLGGRGFVGKSIVSQLDSDKVPHSVFEQGDKLNLDEFDIVVTATGVPHLLSKEHIKNKKKLLIDIGFHPLSVRKDIPLAVAGDACPEIYSMFEEVTPVPGGMGPFQMAILLERFRYSLTGKQKKLWE